MKPISGNVEVSGVDLVERREKDLKDIVYDYIIPDLVVLKRGNESGFDTSSFHISGVRIREKDTISDFFRDLLSRRPHKLFGKIMYNIEEFKYYAWDPFSQVDIIFCIDRNMDMQITSWRPDGQPYEISSNTYYELGISSILKYYSCGDVLCRAIYNLPHVYFPAYQMIRPHPLTEQEFEFLIEKIPRSPEVLRSLVFYIIDNYNNDQAIQIFRDLIDNIPSLMSYLIDLFPKQHQNINRYLDISFDSFYKQSDDPFLAFSIVNGIIRANDKSRLSLIIPFLNSSLWASPFSALALSRISLDKGEYRDCLYFLNASFFARGYSSMISNYYEPMISLPISGRAPRAIPRTIEKEIIDSQLSGVHRYQYETYTQLIFQYDPMIIIGSLKKNGYIQPSDGQDSFPAQNYFTEEAIDLLFDSGISQDVIVPDFIGKLPLAPSFDRLIAMVNNDQYDRKYFIEIGKIKSQPQARKAAVLALRIGDIFLYEIAYDFFSKNGTIRPIHHIMKSRIEASTQWNNCILPKSKVKETIGEINSTKIMSNFNRFFSV